jgi:hypothetical protein
MPLEGFELTIPAITCALDCSDTGNGLYKYTVMTKSADIEDPASTRVTRLHDYISVVV